MFNKGFVDKPAEEIELHNLKKFKGNDNASMDLHEAWSLLIQKVEEENPDWKQNVALTWIECTLVENTEYKNLFH